MSKEELLTVCAVNKLKVSGNDSTAVADVSFFGASAKAVMRLKGEPRRLGEIEVRFEEPTQIHPDTLTSQLSRVSGRPPVKVEKEKNLFLFTLRLEVAVWKTKTERITLTVGKKGDSVFDIYFTLRPPTK